MIDRASVGKEYPSFSFSIPEDLSQRVAKIMGDSPEKAVSLWPPPIFWPHLTTLHGTACLITVWEDLAVDPLEPRLITEEFQYHRVPVQGEQLTGKVIVEEIGEHFEPGRGVEDQVDLLAEFRDSSGEPVASYRSSYRIPVAVVDERESR